MLNHHGLHLLHFLGELLLHKKVLLLNVLHLLVILPVISTTVHRGLIVRILVAPSSLVVMLMLGVLAIFSCLRVHVVVGAPILLLVACSPLLLAPGIIEGTSGHSGTHCKTLSPFTHGERMRMRLLLMRVMVRSLEIICVESTSSKSIVACRLLLLLVGARLSTSALLPAINN